MACFWATTQGRAYGLIGVRRLAGTLSLPRSLAIRRVLYGEFPAFSVLF